MIWPWTTTSITTPALGLAGSQTRETLRAWQKSGHDLHSMFIDPLFVDPARGDFRLPAGFAGPALRLPAD